MQTVELDEFLILLFLCRVQKQTGALIQANRPNTYFQ